MCSIAIGISSCSCGHRRHNDEVWDKTVNGNNSKNDSRNSRRGRRQAKIVTAEEAKKIKVKESPASTSKQPMSGSDIFEKYNSAVFVVHTSHDGHHGYQGSGFFINSDGLAVSNYHVFQGTHKDYAQIKTSDDRVYDVSRVIAYSEEDDLIIFEIASSNKAFNYIPISSRKLRVGDKAYAIGSPRGYENTFSSGEISQIRKGDSYSIQISVPIDHGSSGGVLLNEYGEAIGITSAGRDDSGANLNFAVDIHVISKYISLQ